MSISTRKGLQYTYFDDFFKKDGEADKYRQILFHPGSVLQSRELLQLQTIINEYNKNHLDIYFKNGTFVQGCNIEIEIIENKYFLRVNRGLIYFDGAVHKNRLMYLELTQKIKDILLTNENFKKVEIGVIVNYDIVYNTGDIGGANGDEQKALLDPAIQYFEDESVIGADRLKIDFKLLLIIDNNYIYINDDGTQIIENSYDFDNNHYIKHSSLDLSYGNNIWKHNNSYEKNDIVVPTVSNGH